MLIANISTEVWLLTVLPCNDFHYCTIPMTSHWIDISTNSPSALLWQCGDMSAVSGEMWGHVVAASISTEWCTECWCLGGGALPCRLQHREQWPALTLTAVSTNYPQCVLQSESTALYSNEIMLCAESRLQKCCKSGFFYYQLQMCYETTVYECTKTH